MVKIIISIGRTYSGVPRMFISFNVSVVEVWLLSEGERDLCLDGGFSFLINQEFLVIRFVICTGAKKEQILHLLFVLHYKRHEVQF